MFLSKVLLHDRIRKGLRFADLERSSIRRPTDDILVSFVVSIFQELIQLPGKGELAIAHAVFLSSLLLFHRHSVSYILVADVGAWRAEM
jgi:hypothetical protein